MIAIIVREKLKKHSPLITHIPDTMILAIIMFVFIITITAAINKEIPNRSRKAVIVVSNVFSCLFIKNSPKYSLQYNIFTVVK